ncbi:hypothetical protein J5N97_024529 [Dioscorea zingiberensis]|uniref:PB1-like domain-containing protein n=1 Tax=Dioscorea zingiberensis TaxID=325984 RepID=A0A9D5C6L9_9LILI|nr:hypothetical protein J5N97_024529 [Dioscorea zingiberensis]
MAGYIDYCYADKISILEIKDMAKELNLNVDECSFWWFDVKSNKKGGTKLKSDSDVLAMALDVGSRRIVNVHVTVSKVGVSTSDGKIIAFGGGDVGGRVGGNIDLVDLGEGEEEQIKMQTCADKAGKTIIGTEKKGKK